MILTVTPYCSVSTLYCFEVCSNYFVLAVSRCYSLQVFMSDLPYD